MTAISSSEITADHSAVSATTPKAGGAEETPARGRQPSHDTELSRLTKAISDLRDSIINLTVEIEYNTGKSIDKLTQKITDLETTIEVEGVGR